MGTRVLYEIIGEIDDEKKPVCILYSNSSHQEVDPEFVFENIVHSSHGPTETVERMLAARYPNTSGGNTEGSRVFSIVTTPYGDYEYKLAIDFDSDKKLIERFERDAGLKI